MLGISERFACRVLGQHRATQRGAPQTADDEAALTADIIALAREFGRYGYRRITIMLRGLAKPSHGGRARFVRQAEELYRRRPPPKA